MSDINIIKELESLKELGIIETKVFKLGKLKIKLKSVDAESEIIIHQKAAIKGTTDFGFVQEAKFWTIAYSMCEINKKNIDPKQEITYDDGNKSVLAEELYRMVKTWDANIVDYCFVKYGDLVNKSKKELEEKIKDYNEEINKNSNDTK